MTAAATPTLIMTLQGDREIVWTRTFNAPRELVFDAWTKPEMLMRWFGAKGWTLPVCEVDLRVGGSYRYIMRGPDGTEIGLRGAYREVVRPERLVSTEVFDGFTEVGWRPEDATVSTMTLTGQDGVTTWISVTQYPSPEVRDGALQSPMEAGMNDSFARLDAVLAA